MRLLLPSLLLVLVGCGEDTTRFSADAGPMTTDSGLARDVTRPDRPDMGTPEVLDLTDVTVSNDVPPAPCMNALGAEYRMYYEGGNAPTSERFTFSPPRGFRAERRAQGGTTVTAMCETQLPTCEARDMVTVSDLVNALEHADVRAAITASATMPQLYGHDSRPVDGQVFVIEQATARVLVGEPCRQAPGTECRNIPLGIQRLLDVFRALRDQELLRAPCMSFRTR